MPGWGSHLTTIVLLAVLVLSAYGYASSGQIVALEPQFLSSARFIGIGSGLALWLVTAGNPGFAEVRAELSLPGAFALLAAGAVLALWLEVVTHGGWMDGSDGRAAALALGFLGALSIGAWSYGDSLWLSLALIPVFTFAVTALTMRTAAAPAPATLPGRWRCGASLTIGLLLQIAFIFIFFARSAPMELLLVPLVILTLSTLSGDQTAPRALPVQRTLKFGVVASAAVMVAIALALISGQNAPSSAAGSSNLRVMTFNIQEGFSNENIWSLEETARTIEAYDPDIVVIQEITRGWLVMSSTDQVHWLADRLGMESAFSGNSYDGLWGNAILTRLPIVSTDSFIFSMTDNLRRGAVAVEVQTENGTVVVIDTHLDNPEEAIDIRLDQIRELLGFLERRHSRHHCRRFQRRSRLSRMAGHDRCRIRRHWRILRRNDIRR